MLHETVLPAISPLKTYARQEEILTTAMTPSRDNQPPLQTRDQGENVSGEKNTGNDNNETYADTQTHVLWGLSLIEPGSQ